MPRFYSLDDTIKKFFESQTSVTRQECDHLAVTLAGGPVNPMPIQGAFSYTLVAGAKQSKIVQFRAQSSVLDMKVMNLARSIYGSFVPACDYHGIIGQSSRLAVYLIENVPGTTYIEARCINGIPTEPSSEAISRQSKTVADLARFFGASWKHKKEPPLNVINAIHCDYQQKLHLLSQVLPPRFTKILTEVCVELPLLFASTYPLVLTHDDLCEMNILVNPNTGHISGIIDWAEAKVLPFGVSLWGLENILGYMDSQGWHYYSFHHTLIDLFWQTFEDIVGEVSRADRRTIQLARTVGFFLRYGFGWENGVRERPVKESDSSLRYLDAFCRTNTETLN